MVLVFKVRPVPPKAGFFLHQFISEKIENETDQDGDRFTLSLEWFSICIG